MKIKVIVMLSGGLDSRLALKIMQEQELEIIALFFKLPFGTGCCNERFSSDFAQLQGVNLKIFDCTKGKLLQEYLKVIKNPKYGRGTGINPCIDCRIFMLKKAKEFANKKGIDLIVTGEVLGERPMSQKKKAMDLIEKESGLKGRLLRPLSAKLFPKTKAEKRQETDKKQVFSSSAKNVERKPLATSSKLGQSKGLIDRNKFYDIQGRRRERQIALAKKFKISYPSPAGGCLLCEKALKKRLKYLVDKGMNEDEIKLVGVGRHFVIDSCWIVLGKNEEENKIIESVGKKYTLIVPDFIGPSAIIFSIHSTQKLPARFHSQINEEIINNKNSIKLGSTDFSATTNSRFSINNSEKSQRAKRKDKLKEKVGKLIKAYSKHGSLKDRKKFDKYKL